MNSKVRRKLVGLLNSKQRGKCCYCEKKVDMHCSETHPLRATLEHLKRREDGGGSKLDNVAMACRQCNAGRGSVDWFIYKSYVMGELL